MKVFVSRGYPPEAVEYLRGEFEVDIHDSWLPLPKAELKRRVKDADILLAYGDEVDAEVMDGSALKLIISFYGMGKNIDAKAAEERGIKLAAPSAAYSWIVTGVAELTWGLMIAAGRRFTECRNFILNGKFTHSEQANHLLLGEGLAGKRLGIFGAGRIGRAVAKRASGFEMDLVYCDTAPNEEMEAYGAKRADKNTLTETSDYITLHIPNTEENRHYIGEADFKRMKKTAVIVNTARGAVIDEMAMIKALREKQIAAAGIEVYENEPNIPRELRELENVVLLPHVGGSLRKERVGHFKKIAELCAEFKRSYKSNQGL